MTANMVMNIVATQVLFAAVLLLLTVQEAAPFTLNPNNRHVGKTDLLNQRRHRQHKSLRSSNSPPSSQAKTTTTTKTIESTKEAVEKLKKVLEREYVSFFDPMERSWYATDVSFEDPMTSLSGVDAYQGNVDMVRRVGFAHGHDTTYYEYSLRIRFQWLLIVRPDSFLFCIFLYLPVFNLYDFTIEN